MATNFRHPDPNFSGATQFSDGTEVKIAPGAMFTVQDKHRAEAIRAGFVPALPVAVLPTGSRPTTNLFPGLPLFDSTLGKPIWRNAANTGWVDATGAAV